MTTTPNTQPTTLPPRRRRWRSWILAIVIFLGGTAFGGGVATVVIFKSVHHAIQHPEEMPARITSRLTRRLSLTDDQAAQVRQILARRQGALLEIRRDVQPKVETQLAQLEEEIAAVLTPAQKDKWHGMLGHIRDNWLPPVPATLPSPP